MFPVTLPASHGGKGASRKVLCFLGQRRTILGNTTEGGEYMSGATPEELDVAQFIIDTLNLEDIDKEDIDPEAPLFGEGLGLDSIDALELALAISRRFGFQLRSDDDDNVRTFSSLRALTSHIQAKRVA